MEHDSGFLRQAVVYFLAVVIMVPLFTRLKLGAILGYLAGGVLIGPGVLGLIGDVESTRTFAEFGIVILLFVIGLELRPARLWQLRRDIFGLGFAQVALTGLVLTALLIVVTGFSWQAALVVGLPLALSSTALVIGLLEEGQALNTPKGERTFAILLFQDLALVPLLTIVAALSRVPDADAPPGWQQVLFTLGGVGFLAVFGRYIMNPVFRVLGTLGAREAFVAAALLTVLGAAWVMSALGLSMALGAFVAGVMLADSSYRHELEADLEPFRGLMLGLFFVAVGMSLDLAVVRAEWPMILLLVALVMATKTAIASGLARAFGTPWRSAVPMGLLLSQGGEFGFVIFAAAAAGLLIAPEAASLFSAVVVVSMALTPILVRLLPKATPAPDDTEGLLGPESSKGGKVIVVGYGRFGQAVGQMLMARGHELVLIDTKPSQIKVSAPFGIHIAYGDGRRVEVLRAAGAGTANMIVFAVDGDWLDRDTIEPVRKAFPHVQILARAFDRRHWVRLKRADVDIVVREVFDGGVAMGREALLALGEKPRTVAAVEEEYRRRDNGRLALQLCTGEITTGKEMLFLPGQAIIPSDAIGEIPFIPPPVRAAEASPAREAA